MRVQTFLCCCAALGGVRGFLRPTHRCATRDRRRATSDAEVLKGLEPAAPAGDDPAPPPLPNFCSACGSPAMELRVPDGDERLRACCKSCGRIEYVNPKVVVACVVLTDDGRCLLAKRAIEPRLGTWGFPQGYMENGETSRAAAAREVLEETGAVVDPDALRFCGVYNLPNHVQLVYEARVPGAALESQIASTTLESSEIVLFANDALPSPDEICFPTVSWALDHCLAGAPFVQQRTKWYFADTGEWRTIDEELRSAA